LRKREKNTTRRRKRGKMEKKKEGPRTRVKGNSSGGKKRAKRSRGSDKKERSTRKRFYHTVEKVERIQEKSLTRRTREYTQRKPKLIAKERKKHVKKKESRVQHLIAGGTVEIGRKGKKNGKK